MHFNAVIAHQKKKGPHYNPRKRYPTIILCFSIKKLYRIIPLTQYLSNDIIESIEHNFESYYINLMS